MSFMQIRSDFGSKNLAGRMKDAMFSAAKAAQGVQMSVRSFVRQDTLTLTAYKSLCRCRTYKCEVSLESFTQGLLN